MERKANTVTNWAKLGLVARRHRGIGVDSAVIEAGPRAAMEVALAGDLDEPFDDAIVPEELSPLASEGLAPSPSVPPLEGVGLEEELMTMSPEDCADRAEWRQDLYELSWMSPAPRFLGDEREGAELYPPEPKMVSEAPGPMIWDVVANAASHPQQPVREQAGAAPPVRAAQWRPFLAQWRPLLAQSAAVVALAVLIGGSLGAMHRPRAAAIPAARPTTTAAVSTTPVAGPAPGSLAVLSRPRPPPELRRTRRAP